MHSRADAYLAILPEEQAVLGIVVCWTGSHKDLDLAHRAVTRVKKSPSTTVQQQHHGRFYLQARYSLPGLPFRAGGNLSVASSFFSSAGSRAEWPLGVIRPVENTTTVPRSTFPLITHLS